MKLDSYKGKSLRVVGKCFLGCKFVNRNKVVLEFTIVEIEKKLSTLIGLPPLKKLNLIKRVHNIGKYVTQSDLLKKYESLFSGKGCISNFGYKIKLKEGTRGIIKPCRSVPMMLNERVKK